MRTHHMPTHTHAHLQIRYVDGCSSANQGSQSYTMDIVAGGISVVAFNAGSMRSDTVGIDGNLGADGRGAVSVNTYEHDGWHAFFYQFHSAGDSSVTHMWITDAPSPQHTADTSNDQDYEDGVSGVQGRNVLYMLWGVQGGQQTPTSDFQAVARAVIAAAAKCS